MFTNGQNKQNVYTLTRFTDMSAGLQITGWPAHDSAITSVLFGPDETSIFTLGIDGKASSSLIVFTTFDFFITFKIIHDYVCGRYLSGAYKVRVRFCGQEISTGMHIFVTHRLTTII